MTAAVASGTEGLGYRTGVLLVLAAGTFWSTMGLGIRAIEDAGVWQILFYRSCALVPFLFLVISLRSRGRPFQVIRRAGLAGGIGGMGLVLAFAGGIFAIQTTSVANAMFLFASAPFFAAFLGYVILREGIRRATCVAAIVAAAGIAVMVWGGFSTGRVIGNAAAIGSALGFAVFTIALRWGRLGDMLPAVLLSGVFAILVSCVVCALDGQSLAISRHDLTISLLLGVIQLGVGLTLYTLGSRSVPATELTLLSMTEVLLGPIWVWLVFGETATVATLLGGAVLMTAIAGNALSGIRRKPVPPM